jgi:uncharacterized protein YbjT (DUF2867 family)
VILVTAATGMFGSRVVRESVALGGEVRALVHSEARVGEVAAPGVEPVVGDLDRPETLAPALSGVERMFLLTPMDTRVAERETALIGAAKAAGVRRVVKLRGAVRHHGDALGRQHDAAIRALRDSGLEWTLFSPQTVMETNLLPQLEAIRRTGAMWGCAGAGRAAMVAADDCGRAAAVVLTTDGHAGREYFITGPAAISFPEIAAEVSRVLGRDVPYHDLPENEFKAALVGGGMSDEQVEIGVLVHYRAFRRGDAELVTDDSERLTDRPPTPVGAWLEEHASGLR